MYRDWTAIWMIGQLVFDCRQREGRGGDFIRVSSSLQGP